MKEKRAVVLLSGGIDSSTALAVAKAEGYELYAPTCDYNQRHKRELESAGLVASTLGAQKHLIIRFDLREIGGSALTSEIEGPKVRIQDTVTPPHPSPPRGGGKGGGGGLGSVIPVTHIPAAEP